MILLGVDLGDRRVGFAVCDLEEIVASPLKVVRVRSRKQAAAAVLVVIGETNAAEIVLGLPRDMSGKHGAKAKEAEAFAAELRGAGVTVHLWDERLTTAEAERSLRAAGLRRKARMQHIDAVAAQGILSSYLTYRAAKS